ncbi:TlpA disulfide reductase family protein [Yunchengibacter salinarum]|uniref:TlpA disulfide reductase family protein n=1 Tax=Yunchengibacter salinarum TaxID=3133399 RepID=UPI0035B5BA2A
MRKSLIIPIGIVLVLMGAVAYRMVAGPSTSDAGGLAPFLRGEMTPVSVVTPPEALPQTLIHLPDGEKAPLASLEGKALLINLWAPWCAPCKAEMKELAALQKELGDADFEVVAINVDRGGVGQARDILKEWGAPNLAPYADPTMALAMDLAKGSLPTSLIVDRKGRIRGKYLGPLKWDEPEAIKLFTALKKGRI